MIRLFILFFWAFGLATSVFAQFDSLAYLEKYGQMKRNGTTVLYLVDGDTLRISFNYFYKVKDVSISNHDLVRTVEIQRNSHMLNRWFIFSNTELSNEGIQVCDSLFFDKTKRKKEMYFNCFENNFMILEGYYARNYRIITQIDISDSTKTEFRYRKHRKTVDYLILRRSNSDTSFHRLFQNRQGVTISDESTQKGVSYRYSMVYYKNWNLKSKNLLVSLHDIGCNGKPDSSFVLKKRFVIAYDTGYFRNGETKYIESNSLDNSTSTRKNNYKNGCLKKEINSKDCGEVKILVFHNRKGLIRKHVEYIWNQKKHRYIKIRKLVNNRFHKV